MSFNLCGGVCRRGEVTRTASFIAGVAVRHQVSVVTLEELCHGQYLKVRSLLARHGFRARFAQQTRTGECGADKSFGVGVLVRGEIAHSAVTHLPTTAGVEHRVLLGVTARLDGCTMYVAGVHLSPQPREGLPGQLARVTRVADARSAHPSIIGGDFNSEPDNPGIEGMYAHYIELDEGDDMPTYAAKKIDYVFLSAGDFTQPRASTVATKLSDHRVFLGTAVATRC